jgi:hypothetical protein
MRKTLSTLVLALGLAFVAVPAYAATVDDHPTACVDSHGQPITCPAPVCLDSHGQVIPCPTPVCLDSHGQVIPCPPPADTHPTAVQSIDQHVTRAHLRHANRLRHHLRVR